MGDDTAYGCIGTPTIQVHLGAGNVNVHTTLNFMVIEFINRFWKISMRSVIVKNNYSLG